MLDEVSKALPDLIWLNKLEQSGSTVNISGLTNGLTAVADFMSGRGWRFGTRRAPHRRPRTIM